MSEQVFSQLSRKSLLMRTMRLAEAQQVARLQPGDWSPPGLSIARWPRSPAHGMSISGVRSPPWKPVAMPGVKWKAPKYGGEIVNDFNHVQMLWRARFLR